MRLYFRLLRLQLNQRYGISALRAGWQENRMRVIGRFALTLVVILSFGLLVGMYAWLVSAMLPAFTALGLESLLLGVVLLVAMVLVFFMGMVYLLGVLFFSKDTEFLASLPIPSRTVFAAKFTQVLQGEIGVSLLMLLPPLIVYGVQTGAGGLYWLRAAVIALSAACVPLALAALLSLLLMRFNALWRHRELMTTIGSVVVMVVVILGQFSITSRLPEDMNPEAMLAMITDSQGLLRGVVTAFPPAGWAARGILEGGGQMWLFLGISAAALALVVLLAGRIYYSGAMAQLETVSNRRSVTLAGRRIRSHSAVFAIFQREWRMVLRSPVYALNGLAMIIMGPILLLLPLFMQGASLEPDMTAFFALIQGMADPGITIMLLAAMFMLIAMINPAATTTFSREGRLFYLLRVMPVTATKQAVGRLLFGLSISALAMALMGVSAILALGVSVSLVLGAALLGLVASVAPLALMMLPDVLRPKLSWNSETEAIKQNMNSVLGMLVGIAYLVALGFGAYFAIRAGLNTGLLLALLAGGSVCLGAASIWGLSMAIRRSLRTIEA